MDNSSDSPPGKPAPDEPDAVRKLVEAQAQIEELVELNRRLRAELSEMTLMWVGAAGTSGGPLRAVNQAVRRLRKAFVGRTPPSAGLMNRSVRDYQMLGALSALQRGRHAGLVIPSVELLALGFATQDSSGIRLSTAGEAVLQGLRATLLNTGEHPVTIRD